MTNNYLKKLAFAVALLVVGLSACKKDSLETSSNPETAGVYLLYEGSYGANNSGIDYYDLKTGTVTHDYFNKVNNYSLGETANQLKQYGNKIYCIVSGSTNGNNSYLEVLDPSNLKSIRRIPFHKDKDTYLPRAIAFSGSKAYVACQDGYIRRIDTASLTIDKELKAGGTLEGIAIANQKIYASNSDWFWAGKGSTLSVVDLKNFSKLKEIEVGSNPTSVEVAPDGNLFVTAPGIGGGTSIFKKIDTRTDVVTSAQKFETTLFAVGEKTGYAAIGPYGSTQVKVFNLSTGEQGSNFITDNTSITNAKGITINSLNGDVLISDSGSYLATEGMAYCFKSDGTLSYKFKTGQGPQYAVFVYK